VRLLRRSFGCMRSNIITSAPFCKIWPGSVTSDGCLDFCRSALLFLSARGVCETGQTPSFANSSAVIVVHCMPMAAQHCKALSTSHAATLRAPLCRSVAPTPPAQHRHRPASTGTVQCTLTSPQRVSPQQQQQQQAASQHIPHVANGSRSWRPTSKGVRVAVSCSASPLQLHVSR
jgi:hypothetical protein